MIRLIERLFLCWNKHGISYCHWKSTLHLDSTMQGHTDIDVLVDRRQGALAEELAVKVGFRRFDTDPLRSYPGVLDYVGLDDETGRWVHIHLHYQLVLGDRWVKATWLPIEEWVLQRAIFDESYRSYVIHPYDELYVFCARMALKHRRPFDLPYVKRELEHIRSRIRVSATQSYSYPLALEPLNALVEYALTEHPSEQVLNGLARKAAKAMRVLSRYAPAQFTGFSFIRELYRYWIEFRRRVLKNFSMGRRKLPTGGVIVAFVGIDGSGKTSAVRRAKDFFAQQMNVTQVFLGNGRSGASWYRKLAFAIVGTRARFRGHKEARGDDFERHSKKDVVWYYSLWVLLSVYDKMRNLQRAIKARANGGLVLSDRWPQSHVKGTLDGPRLAGRNGLTGLAGYVAKKEKQFIDLSEMLHPDLVICLRVTPSVACSRKPGEFDLKEAEKNAQLLAEIVWRAKRVIEIDANRPMDEVDKDIKKAIWQVLCGTAEEPEEVGGRWSMWPLRT